MNLRIFHIFVSFSIIWCTITTTAFAADDQTGKNDLKQKYLIGLKDGVDSETFASKKKIKSFKQLKHQKSKRVAAELTFQEATELLDDQDVRYIEPDSVASINTFEANQNDDSVVYMENTEETFPWGIYSIGADQLLENNALRLGEGIKVAVLDTGIADHNDLFIAGGISFDPNSTSYFDNNGHGTHVSGTISGAKNGTGIIGAAPFVELYAVKVLGDSGSGNYSQIIQGIEWAIENHINIISMSFGGIEYSQALHEAIVEAQNQGILMVAAAGNRGQGDEMETYPALYPEVISVGAVNRAHVLTSFTSTGYELDVVAPGQNVLSTLPSNAYGTASGTSMSVSHVTSALAAIWSTNSGLSSEQVKQLLYDSATPLGAQHEYGHGIVNLAKALGYSNDPVIPLSTYDDEILFPSEVNGEVSTTAIQAGEKATFNVTVPSTPAGTSNFKRMFIGIDNPNGTRVDTIELAHNGSSVNLKTNQNVSYAWQSPSTLIAGTYTVKYSFCTASTCPYASKEQRFTVTVPQPADTQAPSVPSNLTKSNVTTNSVALTWSASTDNVGIKEYKVYKNNSLIASPTGTSYVATGLQSGSTYSFYVKAIDQAGNLSGASSTVSVTTTQSDTQAPTAPSNLTSTAKTATTVNLSWTGSTDNIGITKYNVYKNNAFYKSATSTTMQVDGLTANTAYNFYVKAEDAAGNVSTSSNTYSVTTSTVDMQAPSTPTNLTSPSKTFNTVNLQWTASTDNVAVTEYNIYKGTVLAGTSTTTTFQATGLTPNTAYSFTVKAKDAQNNQSQASNSLTVTTNASNDVTAPTAPTNLKATTVKPTSVTLSWTASTDNVGVTGYIIYKDGGQVGTSTSTTFTLTPLISGKTYSFTVKAKDAAGNLSPVSTALSVTMPTTSTSLVWPVPGSKKITSHFGMRFHPTKKKNLLHEGTDIGPAARGVAGDKIVTMTNGTVLFTGFSGCGGNMIAVKHQVNGKWVVSRYLHLKDNSIVVDRNDSINGGDEVGKMAMTGGCVTGVHLHFETRQAKSEAKATSNSKDQTPVDPLKTYFPEYDPRSNNSTADYEEEIMENHHMIGIYKPLQDTMYPIGMLSEMTSTELSESEISYSDLKELFVISSGYTVDDLAEGSASSTDVEEIGKMVINSLSAYPSSINLLSGSSIQLAIMANFNDSASSNITNVVRISTSNAIVNVNASGVVTANTVGSSTLTVSYAGKTLSIPVLVNNPPPQDTIPPTSPSISLSNANWTNQDVRVTITSGTDSGSGVWKNQYKIGSQGMWTDYSIPVLLTSEGQSSFYARTIDYAGNISSEASIFIKIDKTTPSVPMGLTTISKTSSSVSLTWIPSSDNVGVTEYEIYQGSTKVGGSFGVSHTVGGLSPNNTYNFYVKAKDAAGNTSELSSSLVVTTSATSPTFPRIELSNYEWTSANVTATITPGTDGGGAGVSAEYKLGATGTWAPYSSPITISQPGASTIYSRSIDSTENISIESSVTVKIDREVPTAPTGLIVMNKTNTSVTLSWSNSSDNVEVNGYRIYNGTTLVGISAIPKYTIKRLTANTSYSFKIQAIDSANNLSNYSNILNLTTDIAAPSDTIAPSRPSGLVASMQADSSVLLTWNASSDNVGVTQYEIYDTRTSPSRLLGISATNSFTVTGLKPGPAYNLTVNAVDAAGNTATYLNGWLVPEINSSNGPILQGTKSKNINGSYVISLSWSPPSNFGPVMHYLLYYQYTGMTGKFGNVQMIRSTTDLSITFPNVTGTTSRFYIVAVDNQGNLSTSNSWSVSLGGIT
ncbi:S8 family serine peptidase [Paenibacillus sp. LHD-117]|uniref:fibronectin type III domain-containing protein n=1 Tax=Paenibacillus sp. LHD-117 TaxID=3071412 RepID=UPI0027E15BDA|nr:fibronectin type III domain-containing protein [Paenibacillus sp. LHD-117]MDQ6419087.1 S8 family serine peptidase [Paenibacillus sp. LHD-117]